VKPDSPYKGLVPFEDSGLDALLFFGRERESAIIVENLLAARLTVLYGPSGVGKTSVLRAGVAHRLREQARSNVEKRGHPEFAIVVFDGWSDEPTGSLRAAARDELGTQFGSALLDDRAEEPLAETLGRWTDALACDLLLILDQAEEYFLYHQAESGFALELPDLVTQPGLRVRVLLSLRDDALSKLDRFKGRIPNLFSNYLRLDHLDRRSAWDAVVRPVERFNELAGDSIDIEPQLVEAHAYEIGSLLEPREDGHTAHPQGPLDHVVLVSDQDQDDAFPEGGLRVPDSHEPLTAFARDPAQNLSVMTHLEMSP